MAFGYLLLTSIYVGRLQYAESSYRCRTSEIFQDGYAKTIDYCKTRNENAYLFELETFRVCNTFVFDTTCYTGGWFGYSPPFTQRVEGYLGDFSQEFYLIKCDTGTDDQWSTAPDYYRIISKRIPELVDSIAVASGAIYNVYRY